MGLEVGRRLPTKRFSPRELRARIRVVLRRTVKQDKQDVYRFGNGELDMGRFELRWAARERHDSRAEAAGSFCSQPRPCVEARTATGGGMGLERFLTDGVIEQTK